MQKTLLLLLLLAGSLPVSAQSFSKSETPEKWSLKQMQHMLADRPVMKSYRVGQQILWLRQEDSIWRWVAEHYAGKATGFWTAWHEALPSENFQTMHAYGPDKAYIYLEARLSSAADSHNESFETLWKGVVFELFNLENARSFGVQGQLALDGKCTRLEYARKMAELEHQALGKMQRFQKDVWLPWCATTGFVSNPKIWQHNYLPVFEDWLSQYPPDSRYPWEYYGEGYDLLRQQAAGDAQKAEIVKAVQK